MATHTEKSGRPRLPWTLLRAGGRHGLAEHETRDPMVSPSRRRTASPPATCWTHSVCAGRASTASSRCVELVGTFGYSGAELLEKWGRDSEILDIVEGTQQIQQLIVAPAGCSVSPRTS